jgi:DNA-binding CsgD family transcriptional regulator
MGPSVAQDRFAVGAATLSLLAAHAERRPLLVVLDDAHLLDGASAAALLFVARRLLADPIAMVFAVREGEPSLLDGADLPVLRLAGLDPGTAAQLLPGSDPATVQRLHQATGGNPLALLELAADPGALPPVGGPTSLPSRLVTAFLRRYAELPDMTRTVLVLAAASTDTPDTAILARAAAQLGGSVDALAAAEDAGLVHIANGRVEFRHPLVRSAVYSQASAPERRAAHAALADALPDRDADRRAWHLAAATIGADHRTSSALAQAGDRAQRRSAYGSATDAYERAGRFAPDPADAAGLLVEAASCAVLDGQWARALALLDELDATVLDRRLRAHADEIRARVAMRRGSVLVGYREFVRAAGELADLDPDAAVGLLAEAAHAALYAGDGAAALSAAERTAELAARTGTREAQLCGTMAQAIGHVLVGDGQLGAAAAREVIQMFDAAAELPEDPRLLVFAALAPLLLREAGTGRALMQRTLVATRRRSAVGLVPYLLNALARDQATTSEWAAAEASYDEAVRLARESGQRTELGSLLAGWAWLDARRGREDACRAHVVEARALCEAAGLGFYAIWCAQALGFLELALGRPAAAVEHFHAQAELMAARGIVDADLSPAPELVEAYLQLDRPAQAGALVEPFRAAAAAKGQPWALARAARVTALLGADYEAQFEQALALHARTPDVFETARTQLAYGGRLRRARRRVDARDQLHAALETFLRLGAQAWAERASAELAATGETARLRDVTTLVQLTPQEFQIARLLADGATTREAAAATFLSPKTVEYHLRNVYRKLGLHSRQELAAAMAQDS